jgi:S-adenosylmethionine:tRNA ribosyltransferase-isomerase
MSPERERELPTPRGRRVGDEGKAPTVLNHPMRVDEFDYPLPEHLIADRPLPNRSDSRLMLVDRASGVIDHRRFVDLPDLLKHGDLLVFNDSKVFPARLFGTKKGGGARIEILLLEQRDPRLWEVLAQRTIRLSVGTVVDFSEESYCVVTEILGEGRFVFRFHIRGDWESFLRSHGEIPLPPYIHKKRKALDAQDRLALEKEDANRYQTVYAEPTGSAAAPTAGLHFDEAILQSIKAAGIETAQVTLHVGLDTFAPVTVALVEDHSMKTEWCHCPYETVKRIQHTQERGGRIVAVGTTTCRTLETYAREEWPEGPIRSKLFIKPGDEFLCVDSLLTNFHLPRSTLLILVSAFMGNDLRRAAYEEAIREEYRFYSYGDAMLVL